VSRVQGRIGRVESRVMVSSNKGDINAEEDWKQCPTSGLIEGDQRRGSTAGSAAAMRETLVVS
jgi:hypothetical protein